MEEIPDTCDMCKLKNADCTRGQLRGSQSCWNKIHIAWFGVILDELAQHKVVAHIVGYLNTVEHPLLAVSRDSMCNAFPDIKGTPEEGVYPYTLGFIRNFSDKRVTWVNQDDEYLYLDFVSGADAAFEMERSSDQITSFVGDNYMKGTTAHHMFMIDPQSDFMGSVKPDLWPSHVLLDSFGWPDHKKFFRDFLAASERQQLINYGKRLLDTIESAQEVISRIRGCLEAHIAKHGITLEEIKEKGGRGV